MILSLDHDLDSFNTWLDRTLGLKNVWLALTADHGIAPIPAEAAKLGIHAAAIDMEKVYEQVECGAEQALFARKSDAVPDARPRSALHCAGPRAFKKMGVDEKAAEDEVAALLTEAVASQDPHPPVFIKRIRPW